MGRFEAASAEAMTLGASGDGADVFIKLGMMYSIGGDVPADYVSAHKWFNIAAMRGAKDAIRLRREIAELMSEAEISAAQRAARVWLAR
jgi:TPR repeat protein